MDTEELGKEIIKDLGFALKQFGRYTYHDKGADEVIDVEG